MIKILVESDLFIATMREKDRLRGAALRALRDIETGKLANAYASIAVFQEVIFWLLEEDRKDDILVSTSALANVKNLNWIGLDRQICLNAAALIEEYKMSPFDAYHAATAMSRDNKVLSSDRAYDKIKSIERIDLLTYH